MIAAAFIAFVIVAALAFCFVSIGMAAAGRHHRNTTGK